MKDRNHPKFWRGKVRVSETVLDGNKRYTAEWRGTLDGDGWWRVVNTPGTHSVAFFPSLALAQLAAKAAWDTDTDLSWRKRRKVWP